MNLILSPHLDDAVLSLGGLLADEGRETVVATFFTGTPAEPVRRKWDSICGFADSSEAMRARLEENRKALEFLGVAANRIRNFKHLDAQYRFEKDARIASEPELERAIAEEIEQLIQELPRPLSVYAPGFDIHTDHALIKRGALSAVRSNASRVQLFFYQDLPYAAKVVADRQKGILGILRGRHSSALYTDRLADRVTYGAFRVTPHARPLSTEAMDTKLAAVRLYASQAAHLYGGKLEDTLKAYGKEVAAALLLKAPYGEVVYRYE